MNINLMKTWPTDEEIVLLRRSFVRMIPACEEVAEGLYSNLFAAHPSLRSQFGTDLEAQKEKLVLMLATSLDLLADPQAFQKMCADLGVRHVAYGARPEHYSIVTSLLIEQIAEVVEPPFSEIEMRAWQDLLALIQREMLAGSGQTESSPVRE